MTNITTLFTALADPTRRELFEKLSRREMPVGELARGVKVTRPAVSQHLRVLLEAGLVVCREDGTRRIYSIDSKGVDTMRGYLDRMWDRALTNFKKQVERKDT
jgi:DNA-binding transcriptional ArsR family regulator